MRKNDNYVILENEDGKIRLKGIDVPVEQLCFYDYQNTNSLPRIYNDYEFDHIEQGYYVLKRRKKISLFEPPKIAIKIIESDSDVDEVYDGEVETFCCLNNGLKYRIVVIINYRNNVCDEDIASIKKIALFDKVMSRHAVIFPMVLMDKNKKIGYFAGAKENLDKPVARTRFYELIYRMLTSIEEK